MGFRSINVEVTQEHFERAIKGSAKEAIKELIWNACDADAKNVEVSFVFDTLFGAEQISDIYVKDDGHGIAYDSVEEYFGKYGRSQKSDTDRSPTGRIYHGKLGQGRYKSLAIGNFVDWETIYKFEDDKFYTYKIQINSGSRMNISISDSTNIVNNSGTGTTVHIHGIPEEQIYMVTKLSQNDVVIPEILSTFAPYLLAYNDVSIKYNGIRIDPQKQIKSKRENDICYKEDGKQDIRARITAIQWKESQFSKLYICGDSGVVYAEEDYSPLKKAAISVYIMSDHFEKMHHENTLAFGLADPAYAFFVDEAKKFAKELAQEQEEALVADEILGLKESGLYPYEGEPEDEINKVERSVFDVFAVQINRAVPQLKTSNKETKKLTYRLVKEAIKTNPSSIKTILSEVFNLTQQQQDDLAELLTHTHLPEIIDVAKTVGDRLTFTYLLEQMVYNDSIGKTIKERSQFHKILLKELWVFGEKYALGTSDQSLRNLLYAHIKCLGRDELIPEIPPEATEDLTRIPDICLFQQICPGYEKYEHLVIELKRPTLTLTKTEVDQIEDYALKVSTNPMFDKSSTKWHFILLGQKFDSYVDMKLKNTTSGDGNFYNSADGSVSISILQWSTIIQENKFKYEFLRKKLNYQLSSDPNFAMDYLLKKHAELFSSQSKNNKESE